MVVPSTRSTAATRRKALSEDLPPIDQRVEVTYRYRVLFTEEVFARPGLGKLMVGATRQRDYTLLQAIMVVYALIIVIVNIFVDIIYTFVDPRVRRG